MTKKNSKDTINIPSQEKKLLLSELYMDISTSEIGKNMTEQEIRDYSLKAYQSTNTAFEQQYKRVTTGHQFSINGFLESTMGRIIRSSTAPRKYTSDTINKFLENPQQYKNELMRIGLYLYTRVEEYKGILEYKTNMLTYSNVLRPYGVIDKNFDKEAYIKNLEFIKDYNLPSKLGKATKLAVRDDVYFAYEISDSSGKNYIWKTLPSDYCIIWGRDRFETYTVGFDFRYFDLYPLELEAYPQEFRDIYNTQYRPKTTNSQTKGQNKKIQDFGTNSIFKLDDTKTIAFKFDESVDYVLPYFSGLYVDMLRLLELKDVEMISTISDNYKVIHQRIPLATDGDKDDNFLLSNDTILDNHENLRANVPEGVGVATTAMEVQAINLKSNVGSAEENIVSKHVSNLLASSGTSKILFNGNSTSAVGLEKNIQVDENTMFKLLRQYELYVNKRLFLYNKNTYKYKLQFLDHTYYNTDALFERFLKMGQFGFNTEFETAVVGGINQLDFINNASLKDIFGFETKMIPFMSSHTSTETTASGGAGNKKTASKLTEEGARSRDRGLVK